MSRCKRFAFILRKVSNSHVFPHRLASVRPNLLQSTKAEAPHSTINSDTVRVWHSPVPTPQYVHTIGCLILQLSSLPANADAAHTRFGVIQLHLYHSTIPLVRSSDINFLAASDSSLISRDTLARHLRSAIQYHRDESSTL
jgi:hypothetical protein